jgi:hypothetical protein
MKATLVEVSCMVRKTIPEPNETIDDDCHLDFLRDILEKVDIYTREVSHGHGNWIVDLHTSVGLMCIKLPIEMTEEQIDVYCKPLVALCAEIESEGETKQ